MNRLLEKARGYISVRSERSQIVMKNALGAFIIKVFSMAVDFAKVPVLLTMLDAKYYGVFITISSIVAWTHQFDFGLGTGLRYQLTKSLSLKDSERGKRLVSTAYISMSVVMFCVLLLGIPLAINLRWPAILNCTFINSAELTFCVCMVLAVFVVQFVLELITFVLQSDQKAAISTIFKPIANLITLVLILLIRKKIHNSLFIACVTMTLPIVIVLFLTNIFLYYKKYQSIAPSFKYFSRNCLGDIYSLGVKYFVSQFTSLIILSTANILLSHYVNPEEAAIYTTASTYFGIIVMVNNMTMIPLTSAITDAYVKNEEVWIKNCFLKIRRYSTLLTIISILMLLFSQIAFHLWVGDKIVVSWSLAIAITILHNLNVWNTPYTNFLSGVGKMNVWMVMSAFKVIVFFPIAILMIKLWQSVGLVLAIIIINSLPNFIIGRTQYHLIISHKAKGIWNR